MAGGQFRRLFGFWFVIQPIFPASFLFWPIAYLAVKRRRWVEGNKEIEAQVEKRQKIIDLTAAARAKSAQTGALQKSPTPAPQKATAPAKSHPAPSRTAPERRNPQQTRQSSPDRDKAPRRSHATTPQKSPGMEKSTSPLRGDTTSKSRNREVHSAEHDHEDREREL
jgi:hypothetical protein